MPCFEAREHEVLQNKLFQKIDAPKLFSQSTNSGNISNVKAFGLNNEFDNKWRFSYYIGLDYLDDENTIAVHVKPKIENLDYWKMLHDCLKCPEAACHASKIYDIRINKPFIEPPQNEKTRNSFILLIMHHYLILLAELIKKPMVKSYVGKRENLKSKIKGKILLSEHIKKNISNRRHYRIMCAFDEYSVDCLANQLLHSAYKICMEYKNRSFDEKISFSDYNYIESFFRNISYIENLFETSKIKTNPLYIEYKDALYLAKIIFQLKAYNESTSSKKEFKKIPPYIIDMSMLFEVYTLYRLKESKLDIGYQKQGNYGKVDFVEYGDKLIIDTKYKTIYNDEINNKDNYRIEDIRQIAGYARDINLLKDLYGAAGWEEKIPECIIIYPVISKSEDCIAKVDFKKKEPIKQFHKFYKYGISVPEL